jgi:hypothetical protein
MPHSTAAQRNRDPILKVLRTVLPAKGIVLETNSGDGTHAVHFAAALAPLAWRPSDINANALEILGAKATDNLKPPLRLDVTSTDWPLDHADAVVSVNMIHIAPWAACEGLLSGAARLLPTGGALFLYGPYFIDGRPIAPSNHAFDASLKQRNPEWGIRDLGAIDAAAASRGLDRTELIDMPANNFAVVYRRRA